MTVICCPAGVLVAVDIEYVGIVVCDLNGKDLIELKVVDVIEWMCRVVVVVSDLIGTAL